eukprot:COSAG01_NODE_1665_length_9571_cov_8.037162_6_plen_211_part_00
MRRRRRRWRRPTAGGVRTPLCTQRHGRAAAACDTRTCPSVVQTDRRSPQLLLVLRARNELARRRAPPTPTRDIIHDGERTVAQHRCAAARPQRARDPGRGGGAPPRHGRQWGDAHQPTSQQRTIACPPARHTTQARPHLGAPPSHPSLPRHDRRSPPCSQRPAAASTSAVGCAPPAAGYGYRTSGPTCRSSAGGTPPPSRTCTRWPGRSR